MERKVKMLKDKIRKIENGCCAMLQCLYDQECRDIARQCFLEGYPSHGENYEIRAEQLWDNYYHEEYQELLYEVGRIKAK